jgi:hypothetical protein
MKHFIILFCSEFPHKCNFVSVVLFSEQFLKYVHYILCYYLALILLTSLLRQRLSFFLPELCICIRQIITILLWPIKK